MRTLDLACALTAMASAAWAGFAMVDIAVPGRGDREVLDAVLAVTVFGAILGSIAAANGLSPRRPWPKPMVAGTLAAIVGCLVAGSWAAAMM